MKKYRIVPEATALALVEQLKGAKWSVGKARTEKLTGTVKQNQEILGHIALQGIGKRILAHPDIQLDHVPYKMHNPKFSKYVPGAHYGRHTDAPWMGSTRTDLSCTLFLNDDYAGGELCIDGEAIRGKPGEAVIYDCGAPHEVKPVVSGERICAITWLQSRIRDPHKRQIITNTRRLLADMEDSHPDWFLRGSQVHSALLRMWSET